MSITVRRNFGPLANMPLTDRERMREIGFAVRDRIIKRTLRGRDVDEAAFRGYSTGYAKQKAREMPGGIGTVNLFASGRMLQGIVTVEVTEKQVVIGFKD
jgi:hypothetical protein